MVEQYCIRVSMCHALATPVTLRQLGCGKHTSSSEEPSRDDCIAADFVVPAQGAFTLVESGYYNVGYYEFNCPPGEYVVQFNGRFGASIYAIGPIVCSNGTTSPLYGVESGDLWQHVSPAGYTRISIAYDRYDITQITFDATATYGYFEPDGLTIRRLIECPPGTRLAGVYGYYYAPFPSVFTLGFRCRSGALMVNSFMVGGTGPGTTEGGVFSQSYAKSHKLLMGLVVVLCNTDAYATTPTPIRWSMTPSGLLCWTHTVQGCHDHHETWHVNTCGHLAPHDEKET